MDVEVATTLIAQGVDQEAGTQIWADIGSGRGLFSSALARLLNPGSNIIAIDKDATALKNFHIVKAGVALATVVADFQNDLSDLPLLDGIIIANALHFVDSQSAQLSRFKDMLKPNGRLIIVEYDLIEGNRWVPFPLPFKFLRKISPGAGYTMIKKIGSIPSAYQHSEIYSALLK